MDACARSEIGGETISSGRARVTASPTARAAATRAVMPGGGGSGACGREAVQIRAAVEPNAPLSESILLPPASSSLYVNSAARLCRAIERMSANGEKRGRCKSIVRPVEKSRTATI